jgi:hypothetical protein
MIRLTLDLTEETTWADLKGWVTAVEAVGAVDFESTIVRDNEQYDVPRDRLEVEIKPDPAS